MAATFSQFPSNSRFSGALGRGGELLLEKNPVLKEFFNSCVPYAEG